MVDFNDYQNATDKFASYPTAAFIDYTHTYSSDDVNVVSEPICWLYPALALQEEAGEVAGKLAKYVRKQDFSEASYKKLRDDLEKELGDVLWQVAQLARQFGLDLNLVAKGNLDKLEDRMNRNVLIGEGDER